MPMIDDLWGYNLLNHTLNIAFCGGGTKTLKSRAAVSNYIRLVDQAVHQYKSAREALDRFVNTPNNVIGPLFVSAGYFEALLATLKRAIRFAKKIKQDKNCPPISRSFSIFSPLAYKTITDFRNSIEHLDEKILNDNLKEGDHISLLVKDNSIELFGKEITYSALDRWIRELYDIAKQLSVYKNENV